MADKPIDQIIADVIIREGGSRATNDPIDAGGRTQFGIAEAGHPVAWADGKVTEEEAKQIYLHKYVIGPGFHAIPASHAKVLEQLVDFGVNSGPAVATQKLQSVLGVKVDGQFGPKTLEALVAQDPRTLGNKLAVERLKMLVKIVQRSPNQVKFLGGWVNRACEFVS